MSYDAIIVGGSYAGLSAGLQLARARRRVLVIDAGVRRNRFASHSYGFLGQDGRPPEEIAADGRAELMDYPNVTWLVGEAAEARGDGEGFLVTLANGQVQPGRRLILAGGVRDELPAIEGLAERWGRSVFHCPYCHGYELDLGRIGVLAVSPVSMHHAMMLPDWGSTTLFTNDAFTPDAEQLEQLARRGVVVEPDLVQSISGERVDINLADGRCVALDGLFVLPRTRQGNTLAEQLGCTLADGPMGRYLQTSETQETSVPGVFACGDTALAAGSVALAVGTGARAGAGAHQSLIFR
ncbi:thioredoxin reductase [Pseudomonas daroniae]|uniref:Thioredoxin reductase n=1 Tax=Phytopseudomonas daroniae TaxID=2487519 RepID=A0A4Q9QPQ9_9GAMM|nr:MULTISPECIES: NAD(P)/FAD-dependent oxidoreductase [Pseudomonas]TBU82115.1 thioredoxin reductase [Pseudomonas daroniae]TBU84549.1 thioredoxin reductase [Pseudomonas sp. FRB 228]TBU92416.1 thioredoxin reductase [Pseudomonas daroniae]